MNGIKDFMKASRFYIVPVMILPVILGALGAYAWNGVWNFGLLVVTAIGAAAMHLFSNMINDLWDYRNETDSAAAETEGVIQTHSQFLTKGIWTEQKYAFWTWTMFVLALASGILLAILSGYPVLIYGGLGALIAYYYVAPPVKFGYRGKGYSEIAIVIAFGVLPVVGSYYVQTSSFRLDAVLLSLPIGLLTTLILFNHHFLHWRADLKAGKRTLVVVMGESKALRFSTMLVALAYASLVLAAAVGAVPLYALFGLLTALPLIQVYRSLADENPSEAYLPLMKASQMASVRCGLVMAASLLLQGILK
ncbi:prenyltransferase [Gorillibacterium timonense]|uniref:prenyltransferase n=1 Tax=Gorillibacterium timonense TaxID=1689269 RepID=UPI00071C8106|nr:prenyltransferase [Gorillibacterium timonense]